MMILRTQAHLEAMVGRFDLARNLIAQAKTLATELGFEGVLAGGVLRSAGEIELLAGDPHAAELELRIACDMLERRGDWGHFSSVAPILADALFAQGRGHEAAPSLELAARRSIKDDADAQMGILRATGKLQALRGDLKDAEHMARKAVDLAARTDSISIHADALVDLAGVLELAGGHDEAASAMQTALVLYERKGNSVMAHRVRERIAE